MLPQKSTVITDDASVLNIQNNIDILISSAEETLSMADGWFSVNQLVLNQSKSVKLIISSNNKITSGKSCKLLDITIDDVLNWIAHIKISVQDL